MTQALQTTNGIDAGAIERVVLQGDLSELTPAHRVQYYNATCESLGLNPLTKPFDYLKLNGRLTLYARKDCTDQLRKNYRVSIAIVSRDRIDDVYVVTARATLPDGRADESVGAVPIHNLKGEALANALMKCETKAKRRVTLSICGLGMLDEAEVSSIRDSEQVTVDHGTGEIAPHVTTLHQLPPQQAYEPMRDDGPAPWEKPATAPPTQPHGASGDRPPVISIKQAGRFRAIAKAHGWTNDEAAELLRSYGFSSPEEIGRFEYDRVCSALENPDVLAEVREVLDRDGTDQTREQDSLPF